MLVANSGAMSSACLCFYASKPMAQPSGLVKKIEMKVLNSLHCHLLKSITIFLLYFSKRTFCYLHNFSLS